MHNLSGAQRALVSFCDTLYIEDLTTYSKENSEAYMALILDSTSSVGCDTYRYQIPKLLGKIRDIIWSPRCLNGQYKKHTMETDLLKVGNIILS